MNDCEIDKQISYWVEWSNSSTNASCRRCMVCLTIKKKKLKKNKITSDWSFCLRNKTIPLNFISFHFFCCFLFNFSSVNVKWKKKWFTYTVGLMYHTGCLLLIYCPQLRGNCLSRNWGGEVATKKQKKKISKFHEFFDNLIWFVASHAF